MSPHGEGWGHRLTSDHYHLLVETRDANLFKGMRQLSGVYTRRFNRTYDRIGHVFQGRYEAILVQKESYLVELARYAALNPVPARIARTRGGWPWSGYQAMIGDEVAPEWLETRWILAAFGQMETEVVQGHIGFVADGKSHPSP